MAEIQNQTKNPQSLEIALKNTKNLTRPISSKIWKSFGEKMNFNIGEIDASSKFEKSNENFLFQRIFGTRKFQVHSNGSKKLFYMKDEIQGSKFSFFVYHVDNSVRIYETRDNKKYELVPHRFFFKSLHGNLIGEYSHWYEKER